MTDPHAEGVLARTARSTLVRSDGRLELSAPADPEIMELVHAMLEHLWSTHPGVLDRDRMRFELAVIEVLGNIVEHAYAHDPSEGRRFDIQLAVREGDLVAHLADNGLPVALDLSDVSMPDGLVETGRGLALAAVTLDDLAYERIEDRNHWTLVCLLDRS